MKKIRKTYSGVVPNGKVLNSKNNSLQDTYSSDYLNRTIPNTNDLGEIIVDDVTCKNKFNKNTVIHGYWINNGVLEANALWDTSDYIEVKPNTTYSYSSALISGKSEIQANIIYYDTNKNHISYISFQTLTKTEATPSNCYYVRILYRNDVQENIQFEKGSVTNYVEHKEFDNIAVDVSIDELLSFSSGFSSPESSIKRIGNHYFGYVTIVKNSKFTSEQETVATLKKRLSYSINMFGVGGKSASNIWDIPSGLSYIYINNADLYAKAPTDFEYVKFYLDITIE